MWYFGVFINYSKPEVPSHEVMSRAMVLDLRAYSCFLRRYMFSFIKTSFVGLTIISCVLISQAQEKKPLKVFILAGQANMQGNASIATLGAVASDPQTKPMYELMCDSNGNLKEVDGVYISYLFEKGQGRGEPVVDTKSGKLTGKFGSPTDMKKFGPEYTFGLYMKEYLNEPFLIIKTAWGGRTMHTDFRSPSAGRPLSQEGLSKDRTTGLCYFVMVDHVKKVLRDLKDYHPAYDESVGYELAGFVWLQGFNDMVDSKYYPKRDKPGGYDDYSKALACMIRDLRKELSAPDLPCVIGVLGVGGRYEGEPKTNTEKRFWPIHKNFRAAMAKPASMPDFKGRVVAVQTAECWDKKLSELEILREQALSKMKKDTAGQKMNFKERQAKELEYLKEVMTAEQIDYLIAGRGAPGYLYLGSAKIIGRIGKSFADALAWVHGWN